MTRATSKAAAPWRKWRKKLADAFHGAPDVRFAALFGSAAKGGLRPDSDIDIALGTRKAIRLPDRRLLLAEAELTRFAGRQVQLVPLKAAPLSLRFAVARDGVLLWAREPAEFGRFRAETFIEHADMEPMASRVRQAFLERVIEEGHG